MTAALGPEFVPSIDKAAYLAANLETHRLGTLTKHHVVESQSTGQVVCLSDGTPVLQVESRLLGIPHREAELFQQLGSEPAQTAFFVFGLGLGHLPRMLRRLTAGPILIYEPEPGIMRTYLEYGPSDLSNIELVCNAHDLLNAWGRSARHCSNAVLINTLGYSDLFPEAAAEIRDITTRLIQRTVITKNTYKLRGRDWITDVLRNVELLTEAPLFASLGGQYKNVPAFIVGAGPSLNKNIELLERAKTKGLVFATNSAALALAKQGIEPQIVACIESIDISEKIETLPFKDTVVRAFSLSAAPETLRAGKGPLLPFYEGIPQYSRPLEELTGYSGVGVCGSVSTAIFSLAQHLGCSPIVLVGQDMAYTGGSAYATGTGYEQSRASADSATGTVCFQWSQSINDLHKTSKARRHEREPLRELPAWGGQGSVLSGISLAALAAWFEGVAALLEVQRPDLVLINATEGGASVPGFAELHLKDVLDQFPDRIITSLDLLRAAQSLKPPLAASTIASWADAQRAQAKITGEATRRIQELTEEALELIASDQPESIARCFAQIDAAEHELKRSVDRSPLVDAWACGPLSELMERDQPVATDARQSAKDALGRGLAMAHALETAATELMAELDGLRSRLATNNAHRSH